MELNAHVPDITGIPPHIDQLVQIREDIKLLRADIKTVVHEAIDEKVASDEGVNAAILDKRLEAMENKFVTIVKQRRHEWYKRKWACYHRLLWSASRDDGKEG
jgi:hypothetical protein